MDRFTFGASASGNSWAEVNIAGIWERLKQGLDEGIGEAEAAIREVYAVVSAEIDSDLTPENCLLPHHEVSDDGVVRLNKSALIAAVAGLRGLSDERRGAARAHLLRHYEELEIDPPKSLTGEMARMAAIVCGEMAPADIPLAASVSLEALQEGDDDPMEVVVEIPASRSTRGWEYTPEAIQDIVKHVQTKTLSGFLGHQKADDVETGFPVPVTHWVGAIYKNGSGFFRGVIDRVAADLKRWIRAGRVKQVSIFGIPELETVEGQTRAVGFEPLSIDWTPLDRAGMPTRIVSVGEMFAGELEGSYEELIEAIRAEVVNKLGLDGDGYCYVEQTFEDYAIVVVGDADKKLLRFPYAADDGEVTLGDPVEVVLKRVYEPIGGEQNMTLEELITELKAKVEAGETSLEHIAGELGITDSEAAETLGRVKEVLGVSGEMNVVEAATVAHKALKARHDAEREAMVAEVLAEKVEGEMAQTLVKRMLKGGGTREDIAAEIDSVLADDGVKSALSKLHTDAPVPKGGSGSEPSRQYTRVTRTAI